MYICEKMFMGEKIQHLYGPFGLVETMPASLTSNQRFIAQYVAEQLGLQSEVVGKELERNVRVWIEISSRLRSARMSHYSTFRKWRSHVLAKLTFGERAPTRAKLPRLWMI